MHTLTPASKQEQYFNLLRGAVTHPVCRVKYVDDDGMEQTITQDVTEMGIAIDRDDERESGYLLVPPASRLTLTFANEKKQFTTGFGGTYDGVIKRGRRFIPELGHKLNGTPEYFPQGVFLSDDPSFDVSPSAVCRVTARDLMGVLVDSELSLAAEASIRASDYIIEILERVGLTSDEYDILQTSTFITAPAVTNENAAHLLSEVIEYLQLEDAYRLTSKNNKLGLEIPSNNPLAADYVFHWVLHVSDSYSRRDDTLKLAKRLTVLQTANPTVSAGLTLATTSGVVGALPVTLAYAHTPSIRVVWQQTSGDVELFETNRTLTTIKLDKRGAGGTTWGVKVWGDKVTAGGFRGEAASGENIRLKRGKTREVVNRFIASDAEARNLADILGVAVFSERVRAEFDVGHGWLMGQINDLYRVVEKYSNDKRLYYSVGLRHEYSSDQAMLKTKIETEYAGLVELGQRYDVGFWYDAGRIYDEQYAIGDEASEDHTFRGAARRVV